MGGLGTRKIYLKSVFCRFPNEDEEGGLEWVGYTKVLIKGRTGREGAFWLVFEAIGEGGQSGLGAFFRFFDNNFRILGRVGVRFGFLLHIVVPLV